MAIAVRENGRIKQRVIRNLGCKEAVEAAGDLDQLARSASPAVAALNGSFRNRGRHKRGDHLSAHWRAAAVWKIVADERLLRGARRFARRASLRVCGRARVFVTELHRLMVSGSDRACEHWRDDYRIDGADDLELHHLYRAMSWLGEELFDGEQAHRTLTPRCTKDVIEEKLLAGSVQ
jgi:hypothetical protein